VRYRLPNGSLNYKSLDQIYDRLCRLRATCQDMTQPSTQSVTLAHLLLGE